MWARIFCLIFGALLLPVLSSSQALPPSTMANAETIACRALEAHSDDGLKVAAVVFHQRDQAQRPQLAALLREHSGETVEVQAGDGIWRPARMVRLKSCFGRGLLFLPAPSPIAERGEFLLRLPVK